EDSTPIDELTGVSCPDVSDCTAVGSNGTGAITFSVAGGSLDGPTVVGSGLFEGVDCVSANNCVAVNNNYGDDLYMVETDGSWSPVPVTGDHSDTYPGGWLSSVSCTSVSDCTAVGTGIYVITNTPAVTVTDNAPIVGHDLTFTATVAGTDPPAPTGAVTWNVLSPSSTLTPCSTTTGPISSGNVSTYTCTISGPAEGTWRTTAAFSGDAQYAAETSLEDDAIVAPLGGTLTLHKATGLSGTTKQSASGSGWNVHSDTSLTLYQCATGSYLTSRCEQVAAPVTLATSGKKAGAFKKTKVTIKAGQIDGNGDTCGLASSGSCYVVAVGSSGDEAVTAALGFKLPSATLKSTNSIVPNTVDKVTAASFPASDPVIAEECDSSVIVPTTVASNCDLGTKITGTANAKGKVTFSSPGVTVVDGASYTESGTGTVLPGGHADIVIEDTATTGAFVVIPITLHV
ncbi:MAG: hypothetical protein ACLP62_02110, partial [Acidimicrobiales bacterium]